MADDNMIEIPPGKELNLPTPEGQRLGELLANYWEQEAPAFYAAWPDSPPRCETCAFRKGTYPNGCPASLMDALKCLMEHDDFMCHEHPGRHCMGFVVLAMAGDQTRKPIKCPWPYSYGEDATPPQRPAA